MAGTAPEAGRSRRAAERHRARRPALIAYLDTSAFVKLVVAEQGSAQAAALWLSADRRISSLVLYPETRAAVARARRMGRLQQRDLPRARRRVETLWAAVDRVPVTEELARRAGDLAEAHALRAYDALHLASAVAVADDETVLVAADGELLASAQAVGLATAPIP